MTKLRAGATISGYKIHRYLGKGGYSSIYYAEHLETKRMVALKIELLEQRKRALKREKEIFALLCGCRYIPSLIDYTKTKNHILLSEECLGPSLTAVMSKMAGKTLSMSTVLRVGIEVIRALREIHAMGVVHRDVKPSNILVRPSRARPIAIIDFGLSRRYLCEDGRPFPARETPGFVGTPDYASINTLQRNEQSQRDDLVSLIYTLIELKRGSLPWKSMDRDHSLKLKQEIPPEKLFKKMPRQLEMMYTIINHMDIFEVPKYDLLISFLVEAMDEYKCTWDDPYDWDLLQERVMKQLTPIKMEYEAGDEPNVPKNLPQPIMPDFPEPKSEPKPVVKEEVYDDDVGCFCTRF